jgi:glutamate transport system substrate-binding protein
MLSSNESTKPMAAEQYDKRHRELRHEQSSCGMKNRTSWALVTGKNLDATRLASSPIRVAQAKERFRGPKGFLATLFAFTAFTALGVLAAGCTSDPAADDEPLAAAVVTAAPRPSLLQVMKERGVVRVGVKFDVPLFGLKDPATGKLSGFDIEIAKGIVSRLYPEAEDITEHIEFVEALSKNREKFLADRTVDLIISTYTINAARKELVDFAGPYYIAGQDILARKTDVDNGVITGIGDVNGKKVCSVTGSTSLNNLREAAPTVDVSITKDKYSECFVALTSGLVQAMSTDDVILLGLAQGFPEYAITGNPFHTEPYGIGITKGDEELRTFVNDALEKMFTDGTWDRAFRSTIGTTGTPAPAPPSLDRYVRPTG